MIALAVRLAVSGGREAVARLAMITVAVAIGVGLLLSTLACINAVGAANERLLWLNSGSASRTEATGPAADGTAPLWWRVRPDHFDGKVGKFRNTGLVKWGYYMDHLLDYVFLCSILIGYALLLPARATFSLLCLLAVCGGFMVHAFLEFSTANTLKISQLGGGPTEFRLAMIIINGLLIRSGTDRMVTALPYVAGGALVALAVMAYSAHRRIWAIDMAARDRQEIGARQSPVS